MNTIDSVTIKDIWGRFDFHAHLHPDVNFLIGVNGSGKTTAINLISGALRADFETLDRIPFSSIEIVLKSISGNTKPRVVVTKTSERASPFADIKYTVYDKSSQPPIVYDLDSFAAQRQFRLLQSQRTRAAMPLPHFESAAEHIRRLVRLTWLSVHRAGRRVGYQRDDKGAAPSVERRLNEIGEELVRYFSLLDRRKKYYLDAFLESVFLSLLSEYNPQELLQTVFKIDVSQEREALKDIFRQFEVSDIDRVDGRFAEISRVNDVAKSAKQLALSDILTMMSILRIHLVVEDWNTFVSNQTAVDRTLTTFLAIVNGMLLRKHVEINERNELIALLDDSTSLDLKELSSGEKQALIIFAEALLQEEEPWIYIADEPELSLHVDWQVSLVGNIRRINPKAQVIFATHSPDIVSAFADRAFDMAECLT